jgi:hypothetical protein
VTTVYLCRKCKGERCVRELLERRTDARVEEVRCQKVCKGAVAGLEVGGRIEWFQRVADRGALASFAALAQRPGRPRRSLRDRRVRKLSGRPPRV